MTYKIPESVLVVIHSPDNHVLLIERADQPGFWQSVTGSKDTHEELPADTACRELFEETGIAVAGVRTLQDIDAARPPVGWVIDRQHHIQYEIFQHWRWRYEPGVTHNTEHWFSVCVDRQTPIQLAPREHLQFAWLPPREAAERCFSWSNAQAIEMFLPFR